MKYIELLLLVVGVVVLVVGYRRSSRNLLLSAAIMLFLAGTLGDIVHGFQDGYRQGRSAAAATL